MFYIDSHCDTLSKSLDTGKDLLKNDLQFSIEEANKLGGGIQVMACFIKTHFLSAPNGGFERCVNILNKFKDFQKANNVDILVKNKNDIIDAINSNETKVILSIENGAAISGNLENVDYFYNEGIRIMSITWNDDNELGCGAKTKNDAGLTKLGFEYVKKLSEKGIIIDVSHLSEKSFWDVINTTDKPVVATHSNVYEICNHSRNLKDDQIKEIAKRGGMIGICFYSDFLNSDKKADVKDIVKHIIYIKDLVGIDCIGLGSDFDGMSYDEVVSGVERIGAIHNIMDEMKFQGFSCEEIVKVMWKNWAEFFIKML